MSLNTNLKFDSESGNNSAARIETILDLDNITRKEPFYNVILLDDDDHIT